MELDVTLKTEPGVVPTALRALTAPRVLLRARTAIQAISRPMEHPRAQIALQGRRRSIISARTVLRGLLVKQALRSATLRVPKVLTAKQERRLVTHAQLENLPLSELHFVSLARRAHSLPPHQALARTAAQERSALEVLLRVIAATKGTTRRRSPQAVVFAPPAATLRPELGVAQPAQQESSVARLPAVAPHVWQENSALSSPTIRARQAAVIVLRGRSVKKIRQNA